MVLVSIRAAGAVCAAFTLTDSRRQPNEPAACQAHTDAAFVFNS